MGEAAVAGATVAGAAVAADHSPHSLWPHGRMSRLLGFSKHTPQAESGSLLTSDTYECTRWCRGGARPGGAASGAPAPPPPSCSEAVLGATRVLLPSCRLAAVAAVAAEPPTRPRQLDSQLLDLEQCFFSACFSVFSVAFVFFQMPAAAS